MEQKLLLLTFAIGCVSWLCGVLLSRPEDNKDNGSISLPRPILLAALILPVLVFLATLPTKGLLFSEGHGLGNGFLLGATGAFLAGWTIRRAFRSAETMDRVSPIGAIAGPAALSLVFAVIPLLWFRDTMIDVLLGIAIGWFCTAFLFYTGSRSLTGKVPSDRPLFALVANTGFTILLCAFTALGELRGHIQSLAKVGDSVHWSVPGLLFAAIAVVILLIASLPTTLTSRLPMANLLAGWFSRRFEEEAARHEAASKARVIVSLAVTLIAGRLLGSRFLDSTAKEAIKSKSIMMNVINWITGPSHLYQCILLGVIVGLISGWVLLSQNVVSDVPVSQDTNNLPPGPQFWGSHPPPSSAAGGIWPRIALSLLTFDAGLLFAFLLMSGFGVAIFLLAAWLVFALSWRSALETESSDMEYAEWRLQLSFDQLRFLLFGIVLLLHRLFAQRYHTELHGASMFDQYAPFMAFLGASICFVLARFLRQVTGSKPANNVSYMLRIVCAGSLVLLIPMALLILWGVKSTAALYFGLAISVAMFDGELLPPLFALAFALALTQWTGHVLPFAQFTRDQKVTTLLWGGLIAAALLLLSEYGGRLSARFNKSGGIEREKGAAE